MARSLIRPLYADTEPESEIASCNRSREEVAASPLFVGSRWSLGLGVCWSLNARDASLDLTVDRCETRKSRVEETSFGKQD